MKKLFCFLDQRKKDEMYMPLQKLEKDHPGLKYLEEARVIFQEWKQSGKAGLTTETFTACIQSMTAIPALAEYLLHEHGFDYVLSGKLMSDPLEGRFGWYRQTNGGNFFISVKQLLHSEKKIRCLSLLKQNSLLKALQQSEIDKESCIIDHDEECDWLEQLFSNVDLEDIPQTDAAVCYFVSGYTARKIGNQRKCSSCKELLIASNKPDVPDMSKKFPEEHQKLFEMADRGGLSEPSEFCYAATILAMQYFTAVASSPENFEKLLAANNPRAMFMKATSAVIESRTSCNWTNVKCSMSHSNFHLIFCTAFNCFAKNQLKRFNSRSTWEAPPKKSSRIIRKLTSTTCNN